MSPELADIGKNVWKIYMDNVEVFSGAIDGDTLRSIRFTQGATVADNIDFKAAAFVDNLIIATLP